MTEKQYAVIQPYLPIQRGNVRISNLSVISAILFAAENSRKWRDLPPRFGSGTRVYTRMRRWADVGVLDRLFDAPEEYRRSACLLIAWVSTARRSRCTPMVQVRLKKRTSLNW
mgnify:CR=1 FL=1